MNGKQLKNSILQWAIQGKLVPQDPNDEPASVLLEKIRAEKVRLVKEGKLKKKDLEVKPIAEDEIPFEIPKEWEWVRIKSILNVYSARRVHEKDWRKSGIPFYRAREIGKLADSGFVNNDLYIDQSLYDEFSKSGVPQAGDLMITAVGTLGKVYIVNNDDLFYYKDGSVLCMNNFGGLNPQYLKFFIESSVFKDQYQPESQGTTVATLTMVRVNEYVVPLPPLAEQHRIVAKIEELMPLVEKYGETQDALEELNNSLPEKLKKSILQEAIQGKLVPQDPADEPASVLLERIREEKKRLVKEGKLKKKDLEVKPIEEDEIPFEIPKGWAWCRLGDIGVFERGNGIKRDETFESGCPCVRYGEMYTKYKYAPTFDRTFSFTSKAVFEKCRKAHKGDLFMALTGENKQDISLAAQYIGEEDVAVGGDLCHFTVLEAYALYFVYLINSTYFSSKKEVLATGDIIVHISTDKLASIAIPLPPLAEQRRIVAKIEELFGVIKK